MAEQRYEVALIGAGIVGLAVAMELLARFTSRRLAVLEKEQSIGQQTGHNSGVIHSGVYYAPGSRKRESLRNRKCQTHQRSCSSLFNLGPSFRV